MKTWIMTWMKLRVSCCSLIEAFRWVRWYQLVLWTKSGFYYPRGWFLTVWYSFELMIHKLWWVGQVWRLMSQ